MQGEGSTTLAPGWYHASGDPVGTSRYWDGSAWQGQPTTSPGSGQVFYVDPNPAPAAHASPPTTSPSRQRQPQTTTVAATSREDKRLLRKATFSDDLQTQATGYSMLGAVPMAVLAWVMVRWRTGTDQPEELTRLDFGRGYDPGDVLLVAVVAGFALIALQLGGRSAPPVAGRNRSQRACLDVVHLRLSDLDR